MLLGRELDRARKRGREAGSGVKPGRLRRRVGRARARGGTTLNLSRYCCEGSVYLITPRDYLRPARAAASSVRSCEREPERPIEGRREASREQGLGRAERDRSLEALRVRLRWLGRSARPRGVFPGGLGVTSTIQ